MAVVETPLRLAFTVYGLAAPAGSKRHVGGHRIIDASSRSAPWKGRVAAVAALAMSEQMPQPQNLDGPLAVTMTFYVPRPKGHYSLRKLAADLEPARQIVKPSAPAWPTTRPDVLKLARAVEDACTGIIWRDDAQIVAEHLEKRYGEPARVEVAVTEL